VNLTFTRVIAAGRPGVELGFSGMPGWALAAAIVTSAAAVGVYLLLAWLFRVNEVSQAWRMVATKIPGLRGRSG